MVCCLLNFANGVLGLLKFLKWNLRAESPFLESPGHHPWATLRFTSGYWVGGLSALIELELIVFPQQSLLPSRRQALEMASSPNLYQEEDTDKNSHLVRTCNLVHSKKSFGKRKDNHRRDELPQIKRSREKWHDGRCRVLTALDGSDGQQIRYPNAVAQADKGRADE